MILEPLSKLISRNKLRETLELQIEVKIHRSLDNCNFKKLNSKDIHIRNLQKRNGRKILKIEFI